MAEPAQTPQGQLLLCKGHRAEGQGHGKATVLCPQQGGSSRAETAPPQLECLPGAAS